jgi:general stress protein 26
MKFSNPESSNPSEGARHASHVVDLAKKLADGSRPGIFATVDGAGQPHLRWMATLSLRDFPLLYTITSPASRKIEHIGQNPRVSWMFSNEDMTIIINISGKARIVSDFAKMNRIWKLLEDKSKAYFLNINSDGLGFAVIETEIEDIECVIPKYDFRFLAQQQDLGADRGV